MDVGIWARKVIELFLLGFIVHTCENVEESGADGDLNCGSLAQEVSEEKSFSMWTRDQVCNIW